MPRGLLCGGDYFEFERPLSGSLIASEALFSLYPRSHGLLFLVILSRCGGQVRKNLGNEVVLFSDFLNPNCNMIKMAKI